MGGRRVGDVGSGSWIARASAVALASSGCFLDTAGRFVMVIDQPDEAGTELPEGDVRETVREDGDDAPSDADDAGQPDEAGQPEAACDSADDYCEDGVFYGCRPDGSGFDETPCPFGCAAGEARCFVYQPSNIGDPSLTTEGEVAFEPAGAEIVWFDTGTSGSPEGGAIRAWDAAHAELTPLRPAGTGRLNGILFETRAQVDHGEAPELAVWVFTDFHVPAEVFVATGGSRVMVLIASGEVRVDGYLTAGAYVYPDSFFDKPGAAGGWGGRPGAAGDGAGQGLGGRSDGYGSGTGGGGGSFGGQGGDGGDAGSLAGAAAGLRYGTADLLPLWGGSGGGGGGSTSSGGRGGHGAGAMEVISLAGIRVAAGGGIDGGGGGGSGSSGGGGGGGGGSGGGILLEAPSIEIAGDLAADGGGGGGGAGDASSGGDGHNGGFFETGAPGGAGGGSGTAGGRGSRGPTSSGGDGVSGDYSSNTGGGAGGAGRIRMNAVNITIAGGAAVSPSESTGLTTRGDPPGY